MDFYEKKFKKIDKQIYKECKDLVNELVPLMDETNKIYDKYKYIGKDGKEHSAYGSLTNYGDKGQLNVYEEFKLFVDQFKSKNAGKGNKINGSGFYTYDPDNFSFEKGNSYLNYVLSNIMHSASYIQKGFIINPKDVLDDKLPKADLDAIPRKEMNNILFKLDELKLTYDYECQKVQDDYTMKVMREMNKLRDYKYERTRLRYYCVNNNISIKT